MDEDDLNIVQGMSGYDGMDVMFGYKPSDMFKIPLAIAFLILLSFIFTFVWFGIKETMRFKFEVEEITNICDISYEDAVRRMQNVNAETYMYSGSGYSQKYLDYLRFLRDEAIHMGSTELLRAVDYLLGAGGSEVYTPLSFGLSYLDEDVISTYFSEQVESMLADSAQTSTNSRVLSAIMLGENRYRFNFASIEIEDVSVYDMTNLNTWQPGLTSKENERRKAIFRKLYGTEDTSIVRDSEIVQITGKKFVVVYDLRLTVNCTPFTNSALTRDGGIIRGYTGVMNANGNYAMPTVNYTCRQVYCITN